MSTGFLAILRHRRRPPIAIAVVLTVLQTLVVGIATARAASLEPFEAGVICHGTGGQDDSGTNPASNPASDSHKALCCVFCIATAQALPPATPLTSAGLPRVADIALAAPSQGVVLIARRAVRAGPSQAPPSLA